MQMLFFPLCLTLLLSSHAWAGDGYGKTVTVDLLAKTSSSWDGGVLPCYSTGSPEITILRIIIPPKVRLPMHKHPVINAGVLLKGECQSASNFDPL
ncbi:MAG: hypothetical protein CO187_07065, partial [Zetaproteobacteria bacterium CG_4_9_14_3_um_filter_53_7]